MPYITRERKAIVQAEGPETPGDLNYVLTMAVRAYMRRKGKSYTTMNDIVGALESCKAEFQRRVVAPYEDEKIKQNGDVY